MTFKLENLDLFVRVAALGAIGRAGTEFGYSATNASHRIQMLEDDLGVELFHRTTRAVTLTRDGEVFLEHAKRVLEDVEEARASVVNDPERVSGLLRVTVPVSFGHTHVIPFVPEFLRLHPGVHLDLNLSDTMVDIVEQGFDLAFRTGELAPSTLLARKIDDSPACLVASPEYLAREGVPTQPSDLSRHMCIPFGRTSSWHLQCPDGKTHSVRVSGPVTVNLGDAISEWVLAGVGIGQAYLWHAGPDLAAGRLVPILPDFKVQMGSKIWAVRPAARMLPKRVQVFLNFIEDRIKATNQDRYGDLKI